MRWVREGVGEDERVEAGDSATGVRLRGMLAGGVPGGVGGGEWRKVLWKEYEGANGE